MGYRPRIAFSLATLMLLVVIVALVVSQLVMMRKLAAARAEVEQVRRQFGSLRVEDDKQIYVAHVPGNKQGTVYRLHIPPGHRYMLHLTDTTFPDADYPIDPQPTQTLSMNSWNTGADIVLVCNVTSRAPGTLNVKVYTETEQLFDYQDDGWARSTIGPSEGSELQADPQVVFDPDDTIRFMWHRNPDTQRGIMLWMEPMAAWQARRAGK